MRFRGLVSCVVMAVAGVALAAAAPPALYPDREFDAGIGRVNDLAYSSDGRLLAAIGARGFGVWDAQTGNPIRKDALGSGAVTRGAFGAQGTLLALGGDDGRVSVVDLRSGTSREVARHGKAVTSVAFAPDGRIGASGDGDGNIVLWDPDRGPIGPLKDGGQKKDILVLSFGATNNLLSVSKDLKVVTWDVSGKRPLRRGTLQSEISGRTVVPNSAGVDPEGLKLVLGSQLVSEPRGGFLTDRRGPANPADLRRDNVLIPYVVDTGISGDPIKSDEFQAEHVAVSPKSCFAFFTSSYREQPRLHIWSLLKQGNDLVRSDLQSRGTAIAVEPGGRFVAVSMEPSRIRTWRISGASSADCDAYVRGANPVPTDQPTITAGPDTEPLIQAASGTKLAVLRFESTGLDPSLGDGVAELVMGQLSNTAGITIIERSAIDTVLKELEIQRSGLTTADAVKIGRGLNARKVLLGSVRRFGADTYVIQARLVDVETQQVQGSREVTCQHCQEQDLPRAVEVLRRLLVR